MSEVEDPVDQPDESDPALRGPVVRVRVGGTFLDPEYEEMPLEAAQHWDESAWRPR